MLKRIPLNFELFAALETKTLGEAQFRYRQVLHSYVLACYVGNLEIAAQSEAELREILTLGVDGCEPLAVAPPPLPCRSVGA